MNLATLLDRLESLADAWTAAGSLAMVLVLLAMFRWRVSPWLQARMGGREVLDVIPWRSPDDVDMALEAYGPSGRQCYRHYLAADALFPLLYSPLLALSVAYATRQLCVPDRYAEVVMAIPFIGGVADWGENLLLWIQAGRFPHQAERLSRVAGVFTLVKFAALVTAVAMYLLGLGAGGVRVVLEWS